MTASGEPLGGEAEAPRHPQRADRGAEARLVQRSGDGDRQAFTDLIRIHRPRVTRVARRLVGNPEDAEDLAQETFVRAWTGLARLDRPGRFGSWLLSITVHLVRDHQRGLGRRPEESAAELFESLRSKPLTSTASDRERRQIIEAAIASLPETLRTVLVLRSLESQSYDDIARITGVRTATARTQMVQARRALRSTLERAFGESLAQFPTGGDAR